MRLVTYQAGDARPAAGIWTEVDRIIDMGRLGAASGQDLGAGQGMKAFLALGRDGLARAANAMAAKGDQIESHARGDVRLLSPILDPGMILSASMSYKAHLSEMVDYEGEFSCVFGATCHKVSQSEALDYVAGLTLVNDVSARDWALEAIKGLNSDNAMAAKLAWDINIMGKQYPGFCPIGPAITTLDAMGDPADLMMETWVNDTRVQHTSTADLAWSLAEMIAYFSQWYVFKPGDVLTTGSPSGVGFGRKPPLFLRAGDTVTVRMDGIGDLANKVAA